VLVPAVLYIVFSLIIALSWRIKPLGALVPQALLKLLYPMDKSNLDPLRLLHFLALAVLAVWFVPRNWRGLTTAVMRGAIRCGQNSLPIYCLGVLLALASHLALLDISEGLAMQIALSVGGVLVMIAAATLLNLIKIKPRQQPTVALPLGCARPAAGRLGHRRLAPPCVSPRAARVRMGRGPEPRHRLPVCGAAIRPAARPHRRSGPAQGECHRGVADACSHRGQECNGNDPIVGI
jgi:OpgC protein